LKEEIVPVPVGRKGELITTDDHTRPDTTMEGLAKLKPAFAKDGFVTAGNTGAAMATAKKAIIWVHPLGSISYFTVKKLQEACKRR